jgi:hypothetical protein
VIKVVLADATAAVEELPPDAPAPALLVIPIFEGLFVVEPPAEPALAVPPLVP